jgi:hypothetical protein
MAPVVHPAPVLQNSPILQKLPVPHSQFAVTAVAPKTVLQVTPATVLHVPVVALVQLSPFLHTAPDPHLQAPTVTTVVLSALAQMAVAPTVHPLPV